MTLPSTASRDETRPAGAGWTTAWTDGPPTDWDEIRARLRSFNGRGSGAARDFPPVAAQQPLDAATGDQTSARRGSGGASAPSQLMTRLKREYRRLWRDYDPLLTQRLLMLTILLLIVLILMQSV